MSLLNVDLSIFKKYFVANLDKISIDNWIFKLHYRATTLIFLFFSILLSTNKYFGGAIECYQTDARIREAVNTFCLATSTFTFENSHNRKENINGIGPEDKGSIKVVHGYYQWVGYVLFFEAILFYITHIMWKNCEGRRLQSVCKNLKVMSASILMPTSETLQKKNELELKEKVISAIEFARTSFIEHVVKTKTWCLWLMFFEIMNLSNAILQFYLLNAFLKGKFYFFGWDFYKLGFEHVDKVFPRRTKCTLNVMGKTGTIQNIDSLCLMPLNVVNDKIFLFLWVWFVFLICCSALAIIWRVATVLLHSKCLLLNKLVFSKISFSNKKRLQKGGREMRILRKTISYNDWLFLSYMCDNIHGLTFGVLLSFICDDLADVNQILDMLKEKSTFKKDNNHLP